MVLSGGHAVLSRVKELSITGLCATLVIDDKLTLGAMLTIGYIVGRLSGPFNMLISSIRSIQNASISYERLDEIINYQNVDGSKRVTKLIPEIVLDKISFRYRGSSSSYVINNLSVTIPRGNITAIVGESGCGKTTLIKIMLGFYYPQSGDVLIDGEKLCDINIDSWLNNCSAVMQSGYIFSDSIAKNIALSSDIIDTERLEECARIAGIDIFVNQLPMRYETRIGTTGIELSGGEKQRILIARALYKNPTILFLDEATSSLDALNESAITNRILTYCKNRTLVISAHRLSTVKNADNILYMHDGQIVEMGTHEELIALRGEYYELFSNQIENNAIT